MLSKHKGQTMKKLTKQQVAAKNLLIEKLNAAQEDVEQAINDFNEQMQQQWEALEITLKTEAYNKLVKEASDFAKGISNEMEKHYGDEDEQWQRSEEGLCYLLWKELWSINASEIEVEIPVEIDLPDFDLVATLEDLTSEPDKEIFSTNQVNS
jgi:hypothetical protein